MKKNTKITGNVLALLGAALLAFVSSGFLSCSSDGGSGSGGGDDLTADADGEISASDTPLGFAVAGTFTSTPTTATAGSYSNPVTTRTALISAISKGGLIYVKGMIDWKWNYDSNCLWR